MPFFPRNADVGHLILSPDTAVNRIPVQRASELSSGDDIQDLQPLAHPTSEMRELLLAVPEHRPFLIQPDLV